jgi:predicted transcriptional regulator
MKSILMSIQPKWVEKIINGEKTIEVRKTAPKEVPFKVMLYCTKAPADSYKGNLYINPPNQRKEIGVADWWSERKDELSINGGYLRFNAFLAHGKVVGEFVCNTVETIPVDSEAFTAISKPSCLTTDELIEYCSGRDMYGLHITALKIYDKPKELGEFETYDYKIAQGVRQPCPYKKLTRPPRSWQYVETPDWAERLNLCNPTTTEQRQAGVSNSQLYKQAGNSIVVNVLEEIFKKLF